MQFLMYNQVILLGYSDYYLLLCKAKNIRNRIMNVFNTYQEQKLKEVLLYILGKTGNISYYKLMKMIFCAERRNLILWGEQITNLKYEAREHGPVPVSLYKEICNQKKNGTSRISDIINLIDGYCVYASRKPNMDYISASDVESLDYGIEEIAKMDYKEIETYLHDDVYTRLSSSKNKLYSQKDIAESGNASKEVLEWIVYQNRLSRALS